MGDSFDCFAAGGVLLAFRGERLEMNRSEGPAAEDDPGRSVGGGWGKQALKVLWSRPASVQGAWVGSVLPVMRGGI